MKQVTVFCKAIEVDLRVGPDVRDITPALDGLIRESRIKDGVLFAAVVGSTGSLTTIEYEPGVVQDLTMAINRLAPPGMEYEHEKAWHDGNGHSHVQAALMGPSISIAVRNSRLRLGTWQQVVVINHDNHPRNRPIAITITGV